MSHTLKCTRFLKMLSFLRKNMKSKLIAFLLVLVIVTPSYAWKKHQQIVGNLVDKITNTPVRGATVHYKGITNDDLSYYATSDATGKYAMPPKLLTDSSKSYRYTVTIKAENYKTLSFELSVPFRNKQTIINNYKMDRAYVERTITGTIVDSKGQAGLDNVKLIWTHPLRFPTKTAMTMNNGQFQIANMITDPSNDMAHEYVVNMTAPYYISKTIKQKVFPELNSSFKWELQRDLRKQKVRISVVDGGTQEKLEGVQVKVFSDQSTEGALTLETDHQGQINIPEGLLTDTNPKRAYTYKITLSRDSYIAENKTINLVYQQDQVSQLNLSISKEKLAGAIIVSPSKRVLSLKPEVKIQIPSELKNKLAWVSLKLVNLEDKSKDLMNKRLTEIDLVKDKFFVYKPSEEERLVDAADYALTVQYGTKDGFETKSTRVEFEIPSSDSLNPPFPEHMVTSDEGYVNFQPTWCRIDGINYILFVSNQGEEEDGNPYQIWKVKPGSVSIGKVTESIRGSQSLYPVAGPGSKNLSYISNHIAETFNLFSQPTNSMLVTQMTQYSKGMISHPTISRDGRSIAFVKHSKRKSKKGRINSSIWMMDDQGRNLTRLCVGESPKYSPDGKYILYVSDESGNKEIWRIGTDGTEKAMLTRSAEDKVSPDWIDNTKIVYVSDKAKNKDIWMRDLNKNAEKQLTNNLADETMPACSDDGKVVFVSNRKGGKSLDIYYIDISSLLETSGSDRLRKK